VILDYLEKVGRLPKNRTKSYPGQSIEDLLSLDIPELQRPSSRTVAEKLTRVGAFFRWCRVTRGFLDADPTEGVNIRSNSRSYSPFTENDLGLLFFSQEYRQDKHRSLWQFWIPLVALYTGARQSEIAQLMVDDVVKEDGIWLFSITDFGEDQKIKTSAGIRKVPMSEILIDLGFVDYVDYLKDQGIPRVFPDLEKGSRSWGQRVSRWFNETYKERCGVRPDPTGGRKVFHSFRHTAITKALSANLPIQHCQQVFGHERSILGETATYTHQFPVKSLIPVIEALDWNLTHRVHRHQWASYIQGETLEALDAP